MGKEWPGKTYSADDLLSGDFNDKAKGKILKQKLIFSKNKKKQVCLQHTHPEERWVDGSVRGLDGAGHAPRGTGDSAHYFKYMRSHGPGGGR